MSNPPPLEITGQAPLYVKPEPLNPEEHGKLGLKITPNPYGVAAKQNFVPVLINEFGRAACSYPIIFAGPEFAPIVIMGLNAGENLFITEETTRNDAYMPAYIRRYPFIVAGAADAKPEDRMVVCIDRGAKMVTEKPDHPFFENGEITEYTKSCIDFCQRFETERGLTAAIIRKMRELDLFEPRNVTYRPVDKDGNVSDEPRLLASFSAVSQDKLNALPAETYIELRDQGVLTAIFAHWISQGHWDRFLAMTQGQRLAEEQASKGGKAKAPQPANAG